jgi:hypothetical protein
MAKSETVICKKCGAIMEYVGGEETESEDCAVCRGLMDINDISGELEWQGWVKRKPFTHVK